MVEDKGDNMSKYRVYEVARKFKISSTAMISILTDLNVDVKSHMSSIDEGTYKKIEQRFQVEKESAMADQKRRKAVKDTYRGSYKGGRGKQAAYKQGYKKPQDSRSADTQKPSEDKQAPMYPKRKQSPLQKDAKAGYKKPHSKEGQSRESSSSESHSTTEKSAAPGKKTFGQMLKPGKLKAKDFGSGKRGKKGKSKKHENIDVREVQKEVKKTLAEISGGTKSKKKKKSKSEQKAIDNSILKLTEFTTVGELSSILDIAAAEIITMFFKMGKMVTINHRLDKDEIEIITDEYGYKVSFVDEGEELLKEVEEIIEDTGEEVPKAPVVTVMGHVDHGKTSILDYIRSTNIIAGEAGGITQKIGAYQVNTDGGNITFIDTPGHEAFTSMRARGAQVTDIAVIVVAADADVMPQTIESIDHAKSAGIPIIIAINKIDKPTADIDKILKSLSEVGVMVEEWGGDTIAVKTSAKSGAGIDTLMEMILLQAEMLELKAPEEGPAKGVILDADKSEGLGVTATLLVQKGTLAVGDTFVCGNTYGKVRALLDERGRRIEEVMPAEPVVVLGFNDLVEVSDEFMVMPLDKAKQISAKRLQLKREQEIRYKKHVTLDNLFDKIKEGQIRKLNVILKVDVSGSLEACADSLRKLSTDEVEIAIVHMSVGGIKESDVLLASVSDSIVLGFNVRANANAKKIAEEEDIEIRFYSVIFDMIDDIRSALEGLLAPEEKETVTGSAEIRQIFKVPKIGSIAGSYVTEGKIRRNGMIRIIRDNIVIGNSKINSLRRIKDDVTEVVQGYECGIGVENFPGIQEGDILECYEIQQIKRKLEI